MKTQIIQINRNDDHISVCDKMGWSQTSRILLVWPGKGSVLNHQLALVLVKRHADSLGAQLAFVTHDSEVRHIAQNIGIPVFTNLQQAQFAHWRKEKHKKVNPPTRDSHPGVNTLRKLFHSQPDDWLKHPAIRIFSFVVAVLAMLMVAIFILPGATVLISPEEKIQSMDVPIIANPSQTFTNLSSGTVPTYNQEVIVEGRVTAPVSGSVTIPDQIAMSGLRFTNISDHEVKIPAETVVTTLGKNPIRFITTTKYDATIRTGESVTLSARAFIPGSSGNVPANSLLAIEGDLGSDVLVTNLIPAHGGTDASVPAPTEQDIKITKEELVKKLEKAAISELESTIPSDDILLPPTLKLLEIIDEKSTPAVREPGSRLNLTMRLRFQAQVVTAQQMINLATPILVADTPKGYSPIINTLTISQLTHPSIGEDGKVHWTIRAQRKLHGIITVDQAIDLIKGLSIDQATKRISDYLPLVAESKIILSPNWWPRLPLLPIRIQILQAEMQ